jgi:MYXO-CTERM domain-containing protein
MSACSSTDPARASRRRLLAALVALAALAGCGKKGSLRLPEPGETDEEDVR